MNALEKTLIEQKLTVLDEDGKKLDLTEWKEEGEYKIFLYVRDSQELCNASSKPLFRDLSWTRYKCDDDELADKIASFTSWSGGFVDYSDIRAWDSEGKEIPLCKKVRLNDELGSDPYKRGGNITDSDDLIFDTDKEEVSRLAPNLPNLEEDGK